MVTHVLIRLAELREEAAAEEWQAAHPRLTACLRRLRYLRIRGALAWRRLSASRSRDPERERDRLRTESTDRDTDRYARHWDEGAEARGVCV